MDALLAIYTWIGLAVAIIAWGIDNSHPGYVGTDNSVWDKFGRLFILILLSAFIWPLVLKKLSSGEKLFD